MISDLATLAVSTGISCSGFALGLAYFAAVERTAMLFVRPGGRSLAIGLTLGRVCLAALLFGLAAQLGPSPLLGGLLGFLAARQAMLRRGKRARQPDGAP